MQQVMRPIGSDGDSDDGRGPHASQGVRTSAQVPEGQTARLLEALIDLRGVGECLDRIEGRAQTRCDEDERLAGAMESGLLSSALSLAFGAPARLGHAQMLPQRYSTHHFGAAREHQALVTPNMATTLFQAQTDLRQAQRQAEEAKLQAEQLRQQQFQLQQPAQDQARQGA